MPALVTVRTKRCTSKEAVTTFAAFMVTVQVVPVTVSHPFQLAKIDPAAGVAVSVALVATAGLLLVHVTPVPLIVTGTEEPVVVPFPSWPQSFVPEHFTVPSARRKQLWCHQPAVTPTASVMPLTCTEVGARLVVPSPSCPDAFAPQQRTVPSARTAQVCSHPALMATAPVIPVTQMAFAVLNVLR